MRTRPLSSPSSVSPWDQLKRRVRSKSLFLSRRHGTRLLVPLLAALPALYFVVEGTRHTLLASLGRDQGIFQYVAWAVRHGDKDYGDVRDVNGPLIHLIHIVFQMFGGEDEHRFHVLDTVVSAAAFMGFGAALAGIGRVARAPSRLPRAPLWTERLAWALAAWVGLNGQYIEYTYWDLAQRESFCDWFVLAALSLQLVVQSRWQPRGRSVVRRDRLRLGLLVLAGLASVLAVFGKPTYVLFTVVQVLTLVLERDETLPRRRSVLAFGLGGLLAVLAILGYLVAFADLRAFVRIYFVDVFVLYKFLWAKTAAEIVARNGIVEVIGSSLVSSLVLLALMFNGELPKRALPIALLPLVGIANVLLQRKGFHYHFHPTTLGKNAQWLALACYAGDRFGGARKPFPRLVPILAASMLSLHLIHLLADSPNIQNVWILAKGETAELRKTEDYLIYFRNKDYFPYENLLTANYLRAHTKPEDRVQVYGMEPYILFLAGRKSATPYIYAYDLNADAALAGGYTLVPNDEQSWRIRMLRDANEADLYRRLSAAPPAAFVFVDKSPFVSTGDSVDDFREHCSHTFAWFSERYVHAADFENIHVFLRSDMAEPTDAAALEHPGAVDQGKTVTGTP